MDIDSGRKRALRRLWKGESTFAEIAEDLGWSEETLTQAVAFLGLPERTEPDVYLPTPEEIRLECAKLRLARRGLDEPEREPPAGRMGICPRETHHAVGGQARRHAKSRKANRHQG